jgi:hypothetical protein
MRGTHRSTALGRYRDAVSQLSEGGEPFGALEDRIDELADLSVEQKAALWLFAFSLRDPVEQRLVACAHLSSVR